MFSTKNVQISPTLFPAFKVIGLPSATSTIPGAGNGSFTTIPRQRDENIGLYEHERITPAQAQQRYDGDAVSFDR